MKKLFFAVMAIATMAFVGCNKGGNDPIIPPTPGGDTTDVPVEEDIPEVVAPAAGYVTIVINIPANSECNGIAFKGTLDGAAWTGANEYLGENGPATVAECIKFEAIANFANWYKATYKLGAEAWGESQTHPATYMAGKLCLIYTDDKNWEGQAVNWSVNDEYTTADNGQSGDGNIEVYGGGLIYVKVGGWQKSECLAPEAYDITVIVPAFCDEEFPIELVGSFEGWGSTPVALTKVEGTTFKATIMANANAEWKVRGQGGWDKEIQVLVPADPDNDTPATWKGVDNNVLGNDKNVTVDYSDAEKYRWNVCAPSEEN